MKAYGLLGEHLGHTLSPLVHKLLWNCPFGVFEVPPQELGDFLARREFRGLMVTIPYKKAVIPFCDSLDPIAERLGSVNMIQVEPDGTLKGYNTDYYGFMYMVKRAGINLQGAKVLILGTGGAAAAVTAVAEDMNAREIVHVSRRGPVDYTSVSALHSDAEVIINATPVGMYPNNDACPIRLTGFRRCRGVLDVIYNPLRTMLLLEAEHRGIPCEGGLTMLVAQAKRAAELFTGKELPDARIGEVCSSIMEAVCNIVLIGMPGSGKSYLGGLIAKAFGRELINMDTYIEDVQGKSIPDIFATYGEEYFRNLETELLKELQTGRNCIISCGGGVALRSENVVEMKKNGKVVLLTASPETIYERVKDSNDRPLLKENKSVEFIAQLMEKRKELEFTKEKQLAGKKL